MRSLFFSPHADDETLFGAFTLLKHKPEVIICCPSSGDYGDTTERWAESAMACAALGVGRPRQWYATTAEQLVEHMRSHIDGQPMPDIVWAPDPGASHAQHQMVHDAAVAVFGDRVRRYDTYTGPFDPLGATVLKQRVHTPAPVDHTYWLGKKLAALACYRSQIDHPRACVFFALDLYEYAEQP